MHYPEAKTQNTAQTLIDRSVAGCFSKEENTWIIVANHHDVRIFENRNGAVKMLYKMHHHKPDDRFMRFIVKSGKKPLIVLNPSIYGRANRSESLTFGERISARMDEALWNDDFEKVYLLTEPQLAVPVYKSLSYPVRARMSVHMDEDLPHLETQSLIAKLPEALYAINRSFKRVQHYDS